MVDGNRTISNYHQVSEMDQNSGINMYQLYTKWQIICIQIQTRTKLEFRLGRGETPTWSGHNLNEKSHALHPLI